MVGYLLYHTRWISWFQTVTKINKKWGALIEYFKDKGCEMNRKFRRLLKLSEIPHSSTNDNSEVQVQETDSNLEKIIKSGLQKPVTYFYSIFLENALSHSTKYVLKFEEDNLDISTVYSHMVDYCTFYVNKLRKFEELSVPTYHIMKILNSKDWKEKYLMNLQEYEKEFTQVFSQQLDLEKLDQETKESFLKSTQDYYSTILKTFKDYIDLDTTIFKELTILNVSHKQKEDILVWRSLGNRFSYLYENKHDEFKKELSDFLNLDLIEMKELNSILQWKKIKEMKKGQQPRFFILIQFVEGLLTVPYSNAPIERAFSQLKLIKNNKRLNLKNQNLASFIILKNLTKKVKAQDLDSLLSTYQFKKVKNSIDLEMEKKYSKKR